MTNKKQNIINIFRIVCVMTLLVIQYKGFCTGLWSKWNGGVIECCGFESWG